MTPDEILATLEPLGNEKTRAHYTRNGCTSAQFGVLLGDIRKLAKSLKLTQEQALAAWETHNLDAQMLAVLCLRPHKLDAPTMTHLAQSITFDRVADWFNAYLAHKHRERDALQTRWLDSDHPMVQRCGWSLLANHVAKDGQHDDLSAILDRLASDMGAADPVVQWTMNMALVEIGIHHPDLRARAINIATDIGLYADYPAQKGCTPPYAPIWIAEMVKRNTS